MLFYCNLVKMFVFILMLYTGAKLNGIVGLVIANTIYTIIAYVFFSVLSTHYLNKKAWNQYKRLALNILNVILPIIVVSLINSYIIPNVNGFIILIIDTLLFFTSYWFVSTKANNEGCLYLNNIIFNLYKNRINNKNK